MVERNEQGIILEPKLPSNIPKHAQWLAGQGCGSWFVLEETEKHQIYQISRYDSNGILEFKADFKVDQNSNFSYCCPYVFTYLSHYQFCTVIQHNKHIKFNNLEFI
jgi:hypothetical protein